MENMWFLFKILHVRERNTCLCKGECLPPCCFRSFLYTDLVTIFTYIVLNFDIYYIWWYMSYSPIFTCVVSSLSLYAYFFMYAIFIYVSHMIPWWVLFKCFRKTGCETLSCRELFSCKVFQEFLVGIDLFCNTTSGYELSNLRLLSWLVFLLWFCHGLLRRRLLRTYFM